MLEVLVIKELLTQSSYLKWRHFVKIRPEQKELIFLYEVLDYLMGQYNRDITLDEFRITVLSDKPDYVSYIETIESSDISSDILKDSIVKLVQREQAYSLALLAIDVSEGRKQMEEVTNYFSKIEETTSPKEDVVFVTDDIEELYNDTRHKAGLRWRLDSLNKSLGSLRKGDYGFIFARPETGKTSMLASELTHMASQLSEEDGPILWFNNEEGGAKVKVRLYQAALGVNLTELYSDRKKSYNRYMSLTKGKIKLYDSASVTKWQVERIVKEMKPSLIVFDQIDKIKGFNADRNDLRLGSIYIWARELAKSYCPVIGICQSDVSGEGKKWLTMDNVAESKCLAPDTKVLMLNGTWKEVQFISIGEQVMGVDSTPRNVVALAQGEEEMFKVEHKIGGDTYIVNRSHLLSLINQRGEKVIRNVCSYLDSDYGYRVKHELPEILLPIDPYFLGAWLGDGGKDKAEITTIDPEIIQVVKDQCSLWGCTYIQYVEKEHIIHARMKFHQGIKHPFLNKLKELNLYKNKHIPIEYFSSSVEQRLQLIAGLLDTDGTKAMRRHEYYVFSNANYHIASGLKRLALSCGLMATIKQRGVYYYVSISGNDLSIIPCKIERKKSTYKTKKDVLKSRLTISSLGMGNYAGITIDGDHQFIIENNIVTHNTAKQAEADWILGIGKTHELGMEFSRYLHLSKNKLSGDIDTDPSLRHGKIECKIAPDIARYCDYN